MTKATSFAPIGGGEAILISRGVYKLAPLYSYGDKLYAKASGGFIRLGSDGSTSTAIYRWKEIRGVEYTHEFNGLAVVTKSKKTTKLKVAQ